MRSERPGREREGEGGEGAKVDCETGGRGGGGMERVARSLSGARRTLVDAVENGRDRGRRADKDVAGREHHARRLRERRVDTHEAGHQVRHVGLT
jgi:hypothetical protein